MLRYSAYIVAAGLLFGTGGVFVKTLHMPLLAIVGFRLIAPVVTSFAVSRDVRRQVLSKPDYMLLAASGVTALRIFLWAVGFRYAPMSRAVVILFTWPLFFCLFSSFYLRERISGRTTALLGLAFSGIVIMHLHEERFLGNRELIGLGAMLLVAALNGAVITFLKGRLADRPPPVVLFYDNLIGALITLPVLVGVLPSLPLSQILWGVSYGVILGVVALFMFYSALGKLSSSLSSILSYTEVISASVLGVVIFEEQISATMLLGCLMILTAAFLAQRSTRIPPADLLN